MPKFNINYQVILFIFLIVLAIFFRFWDIRDYVVFLGDEGRDMLVMRSIFVDKNITFLGPSASVGGFYLGPIYYWMAAPFLLLFNFDPVGPSYFVALIGVATVILLYKFLKDALGFWPAILVSSIYAVTPLIVRYSRSSWNPNPLPFFSLLMIYFLYLAFTRKKLIYFIGAGASFGVAIQLHYLASVLIIIGSLIALTNFSYKRWIHILLLSVVGFLITFSPFLVFEVKHNFPNFRTILEFVTRGTNSGFVSINFVWLISSIGNIFLEDLSNLKATVWTRVMFWGLAASTIIGSIKYRKNDKLLFLYKVAIIWFFGGLLSLRFYTGQIFDYYYGFMFLSPFLILALALYLVWKHIYIRIVSILLLGVIFLFFISTGFYFSPPNRLINQTEIISDFIIDKSQGEPFNFALITAGNSDHAYRFFLESKGYEPVKLETLITEQLLIVCEMEDCSSPLGHPSWEIAAFGRGEISGEWDLPKYNFKIYRLTHWPGEPSPAGQPANKGI